MSVAEELKSPFAPPPPPLLPLLPPFCSQQQKNDSKDTIELGQKDLDIAIERLLNTEKNINSTFHVTNVFLKPQLQEGPKCGLVALSIASLKSQKFMTTEDIFQMALSKGFTKQGEMFNVTSLAYLAEKCCKFKTKIIEGGLKKHLYCIIQNLLNKNLLLIPYDSDCNHSPCCKKGFKAHWAVISGFIIFASSKENDSTDCEDCDLVQLEEFSTTCDCQSFNNSIDNKSALIFLNHKEKLFITKSSSQNIEKNFNNFSKGEVYLIGMQGKSKHFGLWSFTKMAESNDNLMLFSNDRDSESYVLPQGGLIEGLKGKAIILETN